VSAPAVSQRSLSPARRFKKQLLDVLDTALPDWQRCIADISEPIADGAVTVRFIAAPDAADASEVVIETADIDHDDTTIKHERLRQCFLEATAAMELYVIPDGVDAIAVGFAIRVENNAVAGTDSREFSFLRDDPTAEAQ